MKENEMIVNRLKYRALRFHKKKTAGLALLELLIAIGILGIIAAGVATLASRTFAEKNMTQVSKGVSDIMLGVQKAFNRSALYPAGKPDMLDSLVTNGVFDKETATNPINAETYGFVTLKRGATDHKAFGVVISGLDSAQCRQIATGALLQESKFLAVLDNATLPTDGAFDVEAAADGTSVLKSVSTGMHANAMSADKWDQFCTGTGSVNQVVVGNW